MEIIEDNNSPSTQPRQSGQSNNGGDTTTPLHPLGQVVVVCAKIVLGLFLFGWLLAAVGVLVGFISLMTVGAFESAYIGFEGTSPVVFAGLVCAVVVLFMGIVADVGFTLLRGKQINLRRLGIGAIVWVIFLVWTCVLAVTNIGKWEHWGEQVEWQMELFEERIEGRMERFDAIMENCEESDNGLIFNFEGRSDLVSFAICADKMDLPDDVEDLVYLKLSQNQDVEVRIEWADKGGVGHYKTITIATEDHDAIVINDFDD